MTFLLRIKQYLARPRTAAYRIYRSAISLGKRAWENHIKRWGTIILSGETWRSAFKLLLVILALVLFIAIFWRIFDGPGANWIDGWLKTAAKGETITILGIFLSAVLTIIGFLFTPKKARAAEETSKVQHDANEQQMFNDATAKLGNDSSSVRIGGIYALDKLAKLHLERSNQDDLASIVEILCAHLRETTQQKDYQENYEDKPSNEIQSLLKVLIELNQSNEEEQEDRQFNPVRLNLSGAYLVGANLESACLNRADLSGTDMREADLSQARLHKANLEKAKMQRASLWGAQMQKARLQAAEMQGADLYDTQMQGAYLQGARMQKAGLFGAQMQRADLYRAQMQGADLYGAQMQGAYLHEAQMQGARLQAVEMQGANLHRMEMQGADINRMQVQGAKLRDVNLRGAYCRSPYEERPVDLPGQIKAIQDRPTDLNTVIFSGGLKQEDARRIREQLTECQKNGWMMKEEVERINKILEEHQDKPASNQPPSGTKTGSYDEKEADVIIKEYEKAMAYVKKADPLTD